MTEDRKLQDVRNMICHWFADRARGHNAIEPIALLRLVLRKIGPKSLDYHDNSAKGIVHEWLARMFPFDADHELIEDAMKSKREEQNSEFVDTIVDLTNAVEKAALTLKVATSTIAALGETIECLSALNDKLKKKCVVVLGGTYQHYKGGLYRIVTIGLHTETEELQVVYQKADGKGAYWIRPLAMFNESVKVDGREVPRFRRIDT